MTNSSTGRELKKMKLESKNAKFQFSRRRPTVDRDRIEQSQNQLERNISPMAAIEVGCSQVIRICGTDMEIGRYGRSGMRWRWFLLLLIKLLSHFIQSTEINKPFERTKFSLTARSRNDKLFDSAQNNRNNWLRTFLVILLIPRGPLSVLRDSWVGTKDPPLSLGKTVTE